MKRSAFDDITNHRIDVAALKHVLLVNLPSSNDTEQKSASAVRDVGALNEGQSRLVRQTPAGDQGSVCSLHYGQQSQLSARHASWVDIDGNIEDIGSCVEYAPVIFENLRQSEKMRRPGTTYMDSVQTDINPAMRSILVDWLVEVGQEYRLSSDTLFLSVAYVDRFLSLCDVRRNKLQLVGVTSMLIASKYEEIYAPQIDEFCFITDNTYTREEVLETEKELLKALEFDLTQPTTKTFLRRYIKAASGEIPLDVMFEFLVSYLAELTLMDYSMLNYLPSQVAASCVLLGLFLMGKPRWSTTLMHYSSYVPKDLKPCVQAIHRMFLNSKNSALPASREKYASSKYGSVSLLRAPETLPDWLFQ
eukprot:jgi/Picsp_1/2865/NSC_01090-R1_protein